MGRRNSWGQHSSVVIGVSHNDSTHQPSTRAPARRPDMFLSPVAREKFDVGCLSKILTEKMGRAGLNRFAILYHSFDTERLHGARKPFTGGLLPVINGKGQMIAREGGVNLQHP